jgi:hypothetical protein
VAGVCARCELSKVAVFVESLDDAVDPTETESLFDGGLVANTRYAGVRLVKNKPDLALGLVVLIQPGSPSLPLGEMKLHAMARDG